MEALRKLPLYSKEDPVDAFLGKLDYEGEEDDEDDEDDDSREFMDRDPEVVEANKSVVGDDLHGPTIDGNPEEESSEVSATL